MRFIFLTAITVAPLACADGKPYPQQLVQNQASYDFDCPSSQVKVAPVGNHRYMAEGCFKRELYKCTSGLFLPDSSIECKQLISGLPNLKTK